MIVRALIKTVEAQEFLFLALNLTDDLEGHALIGHERPILQGKTYRSGFNDRITHFH
jgi:hypothetical protein